MQTDLASMMVANLLFSVKMVPIVLVVAGVLRGIILLLGGRRREFEDWTRNKWMAALSMFFILGMLVHMAIRYLVARLFLIRVNKVSFSSTYMEPNIIINVDRPPRTSVVLLSFFVASIFSVFIALLLLIFPTQFTLGEFFIDMTIFLLCWWTAVGIFFNTSIRTGDLSLIGASLQKQPKSGPFELLLLMIGFIVLYSQIWGMPL